MNKEKKIQYLLYGVLTVAVLACVAFLLRPAKGGLVAVVQVGDRVIREFALEAAADGTFSIEQETGLPITFEIREHTVRFAESDCPDKICVHTGYLSKDMDIASCLPNQVLLTVESHE